MKNCTTLGICVVLLLPTAAASASRRMKELANDLAAMSEQLAEEGYRGFVGRDRGNRADVEALFLIQQFSSSANLYRLLAQNDRPDSELRDALAIIRRQAQESSRFGFGRRTWGEIESTIADISRELDRAGREISPPARRTIGRMKWRGRVDGEIHLSIHASETSARALSGSPAAGATADFTAPLPSQDLNVEVRKTKGRGTVEIIQQPSRYNGYTAIVRIDDPKGGSDTYEFEVVW
ncbi:MAG: hypothetical protein ABIG68_02565 [Acidobacteriota bacterium]